MRGLLLFLGLLLFSSSAIAQQKCGTQILANRITQQHPEFQQQLEKVRAGLTTIVAPQKTTAQNPIPVVFHIVLTPQQQAAIGGISGIQKRIEAQMKVLNQDFNATNTDRNLIPNSFQPLMGNANMSFALARTAPDGTETPGYTITNTTRLGFTSENGLGSAFGFSSAKYTSAEGKDAWDPTSYLNIWVINPLNDPGSSGLLLGLAIPYYYIVGNYGVPQNEMGVVLHYRALGKRENPLDNYIQNADNGRTLTHEIGHMFYLFHTWGDDDGKCSFNGGKDDGIEDTPEQAYPSSGCPTYPQYDGCTQTGAGTMYMNFMDYTNDVCMHMFSKEQTERMRSTINTGEGMFSLTQHPELLVPPTGNTNTTNNYTIYPNPSDDDINIIFAKLTTNLKSIHIVNLMGQVVATQEVKLQSSYYHINLSGAQAGFYLLVLDFENEKKVSRIMMY